MRAVLAFFLAATVACLLPPAADAKSPVDTSRFAPAAKTPSQRRVSAARPAARGASSRRRYDVTFIGHITVSALRHRPPSPVKLKRTGGGSDTPVAFVPPAAVLCNRALPFRTALTRRGPPAEVSRTRASFPSAAPRAPPLSCNPAR
jgi:hypothetical protein